jgi:hypothetical protein
MTTLKISIEIETLERVRLLNVAFFYNVFLANCQVTAIALSDEVRSPLDLKSDRTIQLGETTTKVN